MIVGLDHVVVVVPDLAGAVALYEALGFVVAPGGRHSTGTHNALIGLADGTYIELVAFETPNPAHRWWPALALGGGLVDVCLRSDAITEDCVRLERAGVPMGAPRAMSRRRPDGVVVSWTLGIPSPPFGGVVPFLIQDITPVGDRCPPPGDHGNGVMGIRSVRWETGALSGWSARFAALAEAAAGAPGTGGSPFRVAAGPAMLELGEAEELAEGARLAALVLRSADGPAMFLDGEATGNVRMEIAPLP